MSEEAGNRDSATTTSTQPEITEQESAELKEQREREADEFVKNMDEATKEQLRSTGNAVRTKRGLPASSGDNGGAGA